MLKHPSPSRYPASQANSISVITCVRTTEFEFDVKEKFGNFSEVAGEEGFEPSKRMPKTRVLPLHHSPKKWLGIKDSNLDYSDQNRASCR